MSGNNIALPRNVAAVDRHPQYEPFEFATRRGQIVEIVSRKRCDMETVLWLGLHILYLMGFRNRASTLVNWSWNYLTYDRGARVLARTIADRPD